MSNPFAEAEAWDASTGGMLPPGDYVATITEVEGDTAGTGNPQVILRFDTTAGSIRSWETYHERFLSKIVSLYDATGLDRPADGEFDPSDKCRLTDKKILQLMGKSVGIVVREEPDNRPEKLGAMQIRVKGYLKPEDVDPSTVVAAAAPARTIDEGPDIPF